MECKLLRSPMILYRSLLYNTTVLYDYVKMYILMTIHWYITIFDISIGPKCVSIQYHCLMYHDMTIYCCISIRYHTLQIVWGGKLSQIDSCMAEAYCTGYFTGKVSWLLSLIDSRKLQNDLQYTVSTTVVYQHCSILYQWPLNHWVQLTIFY